LAAALNARGRQSRCPARHICHRNVPCNPTINPTAPMGRLPFTLRRNRRRKSDRSPSRGSFGSHSRANANVISRRLHIVEPERTPHSRRLNRARLRVVAVRQRSFQRTVDVEFDRAPQRAPVHPDPPPPAFGLLHSRIDKHAARVHGIKRHSACTSIGSM